MRRKGWCEGIIVDFLLGCGIALFLYKLPMVSATIDEPGALGDATNMVTYFRWDTVEAARYQPLAHYIFGWTARHFATADFETRFYWSRLTLLPVYVIGALSIYLAAKYFSGTWKGGMIALMLYLFNPEILAHSRLLKYDFLLAVTMYISLVTFLLFLKKPTPGRILLAGVSLGLALLSKSVALVLLPLYFIFSWFFAIALVEWKKITIALGGIFIASLVIVHSGYLFRETGRIPNLWRSRKLQNLSNSTITRPFLYLLPNAYLVGLDENTANSERGWQAFWAGEYYEDGRWYYFPAVFLIKTPLPLLILIGGALTLWIFKKLPTPPLLVPLILLVVAAYFLYFMFMNRINHGLRYLLFVYPLLILIVAPIWSVEISRIGRIRRIWKGVIIGLLVWYVWGTVKIAPHYLAFANETIGGPKNLWKYVADSNIDWGQDGKFFEEYQKKHPEVIVNPKEPAVGKIALSVNMLNLDTHFEKHWLRKLKLEPVDNVGFSWLIFEVRGEDVESLNRTL